jgi:two-component system KDP operon response regulator KdpE
MEFEGHEATTATRPSILVVADEAAFVRMIKLVLSEIGARLVDNNSEDALMKFAAMRPDLTLLDIGATSGLDLLRSMRMASTCPLIALTTLTSDGALLDAMAAGADDVIRKPFSPDRLISVVEHCLGRRSHEDMSESVTRVGEIEIDMNREQVRIHGEPITLSRSEWLLLKALAAHQGTPRLYQELLTEVWGPEYRENLEFLRLTVARLRKKLSDEGYVIRNYLDVGYLLRS